MTTPESGRTDWAALRDKYGKGRGAAVMAKAIAGEVPGGAELIEAQAIVNALTKWGDPDELGRAARLLRQAWSKSDEAGTDQAPALGCCCQLAALLGQLSGSDAIAEAWEPFRWLLGHTRDWMAEGVLSRYRVEQPDAG